jgi:hypothetical protein
MKSSVLKKKPTKDTFSQLKVKIKDPFNFCFSRHPLPSLSFSHVIYLVISCMLNTCKMNPGFKSPIQRLSLCSLLGTDRPGRSDKLLIEARLKPSSLCSTKWEKSSSLTIDGTRYRSLRGQWLIKGLTNGRRQDDQKSKRGGSTGEASHFEGFIRFTGLQIKKRYKPSWTSSVWAGFRFSPG